MILRNYQQAAVDAIWKSFLDDQRSTCVVLPTGSGKSLVIAEIVRRSTDRGKRVICLAHRKELLQQNASHIERVAPDLDIGIYSAGLRSRDTDHDIVIAGIQSCYSRAEEFGRRNLVIIDEAHLIPPGGDGMYRKFLTDLGPHVRLLGLTATPFRMTTGSICGENQILKSVCYEAPLKQLIADGYLTRPVTEKTPEIDTSGLKLARGEFVTNEVQQLMIEHVDEACRAIAANTFDRRSVLVFCSGVSHATLVRDKLEEVTGEAIGLVTGETLPIERLAILESFKTRQLRWLINVDVLTTGFDAECIDCIAILRATASPGLFCQIVGRGLRLFPQKQDCLILDFGGNIERHGPIDAIDFGKFEREQAEKKERQAAAKAEASIRHQGQFDSDSSILSEEKTWVVDDVFYAVHSKRDAEEGSPRSMRVTYSCHKPGDGGNLSTLDVREWICVEHIGFARRKAESWWSARSDLDCPDTAEEACDLAQDFLRPAKITTMRDGKFNRIIDYDFAITEEALPF